MTGSSVNLKIFLRDGDNTEIRRLTIDANVATSFLYLKQKLQTLLPSYTDFKITWKDSDNDEVSICSDEDLITAFTEMNSDLKVLYVSGDQDSIADNDEGPSFEAYGRVICDMCDKPITKYRYKCLQCDDYDLCASCEHQGHHQEHMMLRLSNEMSFPRLGHRTFHRFLRSVKKAQHRETRGGRHCKGEKEGPARHEQQQGSEQGAPGCGRKTQGGGCPFVIPPNMGLKDIHQLSQMARQYINPQMAAGVAAAAAGNEQVGLIMDMVRTAVDGFFGQPDQQSSQPSGQPGQQPSGPSSQQSGTSNQQSGASNQQSVPSSQTSGQSTPQFVPTPAPQPQPTAPSVYPDLAQHIPTTTTAENLQIPMDIEASSASNNSQNPSLARDVGWTFVENTNTNKPSTTNPEPTVPEFQHRDPKIADGLRQLHEMGFGNKNGMLTQLLERFDGNVNYVVRALVEGKMLN